MFPKTYSVERILEIKLSDSNPRFFHIKLSNNLISFRSSDSTIMLVSIGKCALDEFGEPKLHEIPDEDEPETVKRVPVIENNSLCGFDNFSLTQSCLPDHDEEIRKTEVTFSIFFFLILNESQIYLIHC